MLKKHFDASKHNWNSVCGHYEYISTTVTVSTDRADPVSTWPQSPGVSVWNKPNTSTCFSAHTCSDSHQTTSSGISVNLTLHAAGIKCSKSAQGHLTTISVLYIKVQYYVIDKTWCEYEPIQTAGYTVNLRLVMRKTSVNNGCFNWWLTQSSSKL